MIGFEDTRIYFCQQFYYSVKEECFYISAYDNISKETLWAKCPFPTFKLQKHYCFCLNYESQVLFRIKIVDIRDGKEIVRRVEDYYCPQPEEYEEQTPEEFLDDYRGFFYEVWEEFELLLKTTVIPILPEYFPAIPCA